MRLRTVDARGSHHSRLVSQSERGCLTRRISFLKIPLGHYIYKQNSRRPSKAPKKETNKKIIPKKKELQNFPPFSLTLSLFLLIKKKIILIIFPFSKKLFLPKKIFIPLFSFLQIFTIFVIK